MASISYAYEFLIPLILLMAGVRDDYTLTINIIFILALLQFIIMDNPKIYHVIVYWIGIIPVLIVSIVKGSAAKIWGIIFLLLIILNGIYISSVHGPYTETLDRIKFMACGIIYWLVAYVTLSFFGHVQERYRNQLQSQNKELQH